MNAIATFRKCTLTDRELLEKVDSMTDKMYSNPPYEVPYRHIPARPNDDYDLLVGELILRFKERIESLSADQAGEDSAIKLLREYREMLLTPLDKNVPLAEVMKMGEWFKRVEALLDTKPTTH
jgi:hypothetical protein